MSEDQFWDDLLGHIRHQMLVPVVGPDLTVAKVGNAEETFNRLICRCLAERYHVTPAVATMGEAVAAVLRKEGRDELDRLYRVINDIIDKYPEPGASLRDLAAIGDFRFFVSTTPDRLLGQAVNEVRYQGRPVTLELPFSTTKATSQQVGNARARPTDTTVLNLFGKATPLPEYAIHEEDRLEWLHAFRDTASLPEWLDYPLRHHAMLFVGCEIPDWFGRFLLRSSSSTRLSLERKPFFIVSSSSYESSLSDFVRTYCRTSLVQELDMEPAAFVAELRARWEQENRPLTDSGQDVPIPVATDPPTIFISYMREDADAAGRVYDSIRELGGDVWMDKHELYAGDSWAEEISTAIRKTIRLFVPIISANTERTAEGYVFREWREAVDRARSILGHRFIVPVIVAADYNGDPSSYGNFPPEFNSFHFGRAPAGDPDADLLKTLKDEIRAMRRIDAA